MNTKRNNTKFQRKKCSRAFLFLLAAMMMLLTGCGGSEPKFSLDETALAENLLENGTFDCQLYQVKEDRIADFLELEAPQKQILCMGNGTYADSFGIFTMTDSDGAKAAMETIRAYLEDLKNSYQDYLPEEADKIANAVTMQKGNYAVFCITPNPESAQQIIESAITESDDDAQTVNTENNGESKKTPTIETKAGVKDFGSIAVIGDSAYELYTYLDKPAQKYANTVNRAAEALAGKTNVYDVLIPLSSGITLPDADYDKIASSNQQKALDSICEKLSKDVNVINPYDSLMQHRDEYLYFRTDHHWTADGAYYTYREFCKQKDILPISLKRHETKEFPGFLGSFYQDTKAKTLKKNPDDVIAYLPISKLSMKCTEADGTKISYPVIYDVSNHPASLKYNAFLAGDHAYAEITNEDLTDQSACIVVKESFGNAWIPFLADHYQKIYVVDYRYWEGDLIKLAKKTKAEDLIFVNNLSMIRSDYLTGRFSQLIP